MLGFGAKNKWFEESLAPLSLGRCKLSQATPDTVTSHLSSSKQQGHVTTIIDINKSILNYTSSDTFMFLLTVILYTYAQIPIVQSIHIPRAVTVLQIPKTK